ncbi:cytochrome o ubiquinol oxidase subunit IV [Bradyrhizobium sp.]|uniref:cytochrome o ubiquinol oxidase subunit IV n=1 Tax=Bradyrhizobium sp. TaxID=376 RepID=UPI003C5EF7E2
MTVDAPAHAHGGPAHATRKGYLIGFGLSVILTAVPFWLVMAGPISSNMAATFAVVGLALTQIVVHMIFFLHMDTKSESGWTFMALIFTIVLIVIALSGSLWVMYHLTTNMMPMSAHDMKQLP